MCVKTYPLIEKAHFIWIWAGDPTKADESLLPDHYALGLDQPGWTAAPYFMLEIKANYSMLFENLLDTSHISFLHGSVLDSGRMAQASFRIEHDEQSVRLVRDLKGDMPNLSNASTGSSRA
jgi:phenylpropionate dioxygenase-like ring-hydroxylating dioxygenase large terminal subunit